MVTQNKKNVKILLTGGGTGGSVAPLLAIVNELKSYKVYKVESNDIFDFLWLGTKKGPEREMVEKEGIKFRAICSGKLRRYFSPHNFIDFFRIKIAFYQALFIILKWKPDLVMCAGSFVGVPVVWAAWLLRVPILIHQQDARPGLANKLMAPFARVITVTFEKSLADYGKKAVWVGNPVRQSLTENSPPRSALSGRGKQPAPLRFVGPGKIENRLGLKDDLPIVLIIGGGTGALAINQLVEQSLDELTEFCQIIHITGKNKAPNYQLPITNYQIHEFLNARQMSEAYAVADVVVSRCGMGVLTELSYLAKPAILIPIPDSHQEENAEVFQEKDAAIVLDQKDLTAKKLVENIKKLLDDEMLRNKLGNNIKNVIKRGANERIVEIIVKAISNK